MPNSLPPSDLLTPELRAIDARVQVMREGDPLPTGTVAVVFRFATAGDDVGLSPLALAVQPNDLHAILQRVERALAGRPMDDDDPAVVAHEERWGTVEYQPNQPSWITSGMAGEGMGVSECDGVLAGIEVECRGSSWSINLQVASGLAFDFSASIGLVEELWDLLYERWQDLDPAAGLWV